MSSIKELVVVYNTAVTDAQEECSKATTAAYRVFDEATTAHREEYNRAVRAAQTKLNEDNSEHAKVHDAASRAADTLKKEKMAAALDEFAAKISEADAGLGKLVQWLAKDSANDDGDNISVWEEYPEHCAMVLEALPMSLEEMERFRLDQGWCGEFTEILERAMDAGVLVDVQKDPKELALAAFKRTLNNTVSYHSQRINVEKAVRKLLADLGVSLETAPADA